MTAPASVSSGSTFARFRASLNLHDRRSLAGMLGFIFLPRVIGFGVMFGLILPHHYRLPAFRTRGLCRCAVPRGR